MPLRLQLPRRELYIHSLHSRSPHCPTTPLHLHRPPHDSYRHRDNKHLSTSTLAVPKRIINTTRKMSTSTPGPPTSSSSSPPSPPSLPSLPSPAPPPNPNPNPPAGPAPYFARGQESQHASLEKRLDALLASDAACGVEDEGGGGHRARNWKVVGDGKGIEKMWCFRTFRITRVSFFLVFFLLFCLR